MLPSLKLKKAELESPKSIGWRPDFRVPEDLPDTKVVRTTFFINALTMTLGIAALILVGMREYQTYSLLQQEASSRQFIESNKPFNEQALRLTRDFATQEAKFTEAMKFSDVPMRAAEMLVIMGETLPANVRVSSIELRIDAAGAPSAVVRGVTAGSREQASGATSVYVDTLAKHPRLSAVFGDIALSNMNADPNANMLIFEVQLRQKKGKGAQKK